MMITPVLEAVALVAWGQEQGINPDTWIYQCKPSLNARVEIVCRENDHQDLVPPIEEIGKIGYLSFCALKEPEPIRTKMLTLQPITPGIWGAYSVKENTLAIGVVE